MKYTVREEDVKLELGNTPILVEAGILLAIIGLVLLLRWTGYTGIAVFVTIAVFCYYIVVAYVKMTFCQFKEGTVLLLEKSSFGTLVKVEGQSAMWLPMLVREGSEEGLNVYTLTLKILKEGETLISRRDDVSEDAELPDLKELVNSFRSKKGD